MNRVWTLEESLAYTRWLATHHYENFQVSASLAAEAPASGFL